MNVRGAFLHVIGDLLSSVAVIVAAVVIRFTGLNVVDPLLSALIGLVIVIGAVRLLKAAADILLEAAPAGRRPGGSPVRPAHDRNGEGLHDLHVWSLFLRSSCAQRAPDREDQMTAQSDRVLERAADIWMSRFAHRPYHRCIEARPSGDLPHDGTPAVIPRGARRRGRFQVHRFGGRRSASCSSRTPASRMAASQSAGLCDHWP